MITISRTSNAPVETVWKLLVDLEGWPAWTPSMEKIERLDSGPLTIGSTARVRQPGAAPMIWRVTTLTDGGEFTWQTHRPGVTTVGRHVLAPQEHGTRIELSLFHHGWLAWLARLIADRKLADYVLMEANGLQAASDSAAPSR